jgi:hypothetical protein
MAPIDALDRSRLGGSGGGLVRRLFRLRLGFRAAGEREDGEGDERLAHGWRR